MEEETSAPREGIILDQGCLRQNNLRIIPANISEVSVNQAALPKNQRSQTVKLMANFVNWSPMSDRKVYQY